ncbi:MAG: hypothetical protein AAB676_14680 [Verrucomicrobiota bacterium]
MTNDECRTGVKSSRHQAVFGTKDPQAVLEGTVHLLLACLWIAGQPVEVIEEFKAPFGLLGDERQVAETEFLQRVSEVEHVHFLGFLDFAADGPVLVTSSSASSTRLTKTVIRSSFSPS